MILNRIINLTISFAFTFSIGMILFLSIRFGNRLIDSLISVGFIFRMEYLVYGLLFGILWWAFHSVFFKK
jgi:hypothetical protein